MMEDGNVKIYLDKNSVLVVISIVKFAENLKKKFIFKLQSLK